MRFSNVNSAKVNEKDKGRILSLLADNKHRADNRYTNCTSHHDVGLWISFFYLSYAYHILWRNLETCPIFHLKIFIIRYLRKNNFVIIWDFLHIKRWLKKARHTWERSKGVLLLVKIWGSLFIRELLSTSCVCVRGNETRRLR